MPVSFKKSKSTDKIIAVINGRIKVGEVVDNTVKITGHPSAGVLFEITKAAEKAGYKVLNPHGGARPGSGQPKKPYRTVTISIRVHEDDADTVRKLIAPYKIGNRGK